MRTTAMIGSGLIATPTAEGRKSPIAWPTAEDDNVRPRMAEADMADRLARVVSVKNDWAAVFAV